MAKIDKARFWTGVLYPENMRGGLERGHRRYFAVPLCVLSALKDKDTRANTAKTMCI